MDDMTNKELFHLIKASNKETRERLRSIEEKLDSFILFFDEMNEDVEDMAMN